MPSDTNPTQRLSGATTQRGRWAHLQHWLFICTQTTGDGDFPGHCVFPPTLLTYELKMLMKLAFGLFNELPRASWVQPPAEWGELGGLSGPSLLPSPASPLEPGQQHWQRCLADPFVTNLLEGCWQLFLVFHHLLFLIILHNPCMCFTCSSSNLVGPVVPSHG